MSEINITGLSLKIYICNVHLLEKGIFYLRKNLQPFSRFYSNQNYMLLKQIPAVSIILGQAAYSAKQIMTSYDTNDQW